MRVSGRRWLGMVAVALAVAVAGARGAAAQSLPTTPQGWAVFGLEEVVIGGKGRITGDVGANQGTVELKSGTQVRGAVAGENVTLRKADVDALYCTLVIGGDVPCQTVPTPVVPLVNIPVVQVTPGTQPVDVPKRGQRSPLPAGTYAAVTIGQKSQLLLSGGNYVFDSIKLASRAKLLCQTTCTVGVRKNAKFGQATQLGAQGTDPTAFTLAVQGEAKGPAVKVASRAQITGVLYAPTGDVSVGQSVTANGALVGQRVHVASRAKLTAAGS